MEDALDIHIHRKDKYAFRCGNCRVSYRALRLFVFLVMAFLLLGLAVWRAVRQKKTVYDAAWDIVLVLIGLLVPNF